MNFARPVVVDMGVLVSAAIRPQSVPALALERALLHYDVCASQATFAELQTVLLRSKFDRYACVTARQLFVQGLSQHLRMVEVTQQVTDCIDPKDNKWVTTSLTYMPSIAVFLLIALPWLNPFSPGPSPAVVPLLFAWACAAALLLVFRGVPGRHLDPRLVSATAAAWLFAALLSAALGLLQYFGATGALAPWVSSTGMGEAYANLRQRNQFASLTNIGLLALLWWAALGRSSAAGPAAAARTEPRHWPAALLPLAAALLLGAGNAASSSRTGLVQLLLLALLVLCWGGLRQPAVRRILLAAGLAYALASLALPGLAGLDLGATGILARLQDGERGCASRLTLWANVLHLIAQKPWLGWGWGELDYAHFVTLYPGARFCEILDNAHNLPLHLAVELGIPAALAVCGGGLWLVWRARPWRETDATRQMAWGVLAVILLHSMLEYPLWYGPFQLALGLCLWLLWRTSGLPGGAGAMPYTVHRAVAPTAARSRRFMPTAPYLSALSAMLIIAFVAYAAWEYRRISQLYLIPAMRADAYRDNTQQKIGDSWLFQNQVRFAELSTTPVTRDNAAHIKELAAAVLHFSPEPRVIEKLIESALLLGLEDEALFYQVRYQAAFPESHARWAKAQARERS